MRRKDSRGRALMAAAIATTLAACAANSGSGLPSVSSHVVSPARPANAPTLPQVVKGPLLYAVSSGNAVHMYSYPQAKLLASLTGFNEVTGICSDAQGHVFVVDQGAQKIKEYAHGVLRPFRVLRDSVGDAASCASDPSSGDLAVANLQGHYGSGPGSVLIYKGARGSPTVYFDPKIPFVWSVGYDGQGNLFADGSPYRSDGFRLGELVKGTNHFVNIQLNQPLTFAGNVQWDGTYMTVGDESPASGGYTIYQFQGKKIVGTIKLGNEESLGTYLILGKTVLLSQDGLSLFKYPAGGAPLKKFKLAGYPPSYVTVSKL